MQDSLTRTMDPAVMRGRVLKLLIKMPDLSTQLQAQPKPPEMGRKESFQMALYARLLPGLMPMVTATIEGMGDERLISYINFIKSTLEILGNPTVSETEFDAFLEGKVIDASSSPEHAHTTS